MYTEEYNKRPFPFRDFLLKFIIVVVFALFLIWVIPKFTSPKTKNTETTVSKVFQKNLNTMKQASINYYSEKANLPTDDNKEVLTLRQMIDKKMLTAFTDNKGKACDVDKSYSEIYSDNGDYVLKVKLKCSSEEDYVLTKIGSYSYCNGEVCEKDLNKTDENSKTASTADDSTSDSVETPDTSDDSSIYDEGESTSQVSYSYEYKKTTEAVLSEFPDWNDANWVKNSNRYTNITCEATDVTCLKEITTKTEKKVVGTSAKGNVVATVSYYQVRYRTYTPASMDIKWSSENDQNLIAAGYVTTGNKKEIN